MNYPEPNPLKPTDQSICHLFTLPVIHYTYSIIPQHWQPEVTEETVSAEKETHSIWQRASPAARCGRLSMNALCSLQPAGCLHKLRIYMFMKRGSYRALFTQSVPTERVCVCFYRAAASAVAPASVGLTLVGCCWLAAHTPTGPVAVAAAAAAAARGVRTCRPPRSAGAQRTHLVANEEAQSERKHLPTELIISPIWT